MKNIMRKLIKKIYYIYLRYKFYKDIRIALIKSKKRRNRAWILKQAKYECLLCGTKKNLTIDHIKPKKHGGSKSNLGNMQCLCFMCNFLKDNKTPKKWKRKLSPVINSHHLSSIYGFATIEVLQG